MNEKISLKRIIVLAIILIIIFCVILLLLSKKQQLRPAINYGVVPNDIAEYVPENYEYNEATRTYVPAPSYEIIYPNNSNYELESFTGDGLPDTFVDNEGHPYTKQFFPSLGYMMFVPDNFHMVEHNSDYLENTYYLKPDEDSGINERVQICVSSIVGTKNLSALQVKNMFEPSFINYEYNVYLNRYVSTWYESKSFDPIPIKSVPGFEHCNDDSIVAYLDTPYMVFQLPSHPDNIIKPVVHMYYVMKDNVAVLISVIGGLTDQIDMAYLGGTMAYNIREIVNNDTNALPYDDLVPVKNFGNFTISIPKTWEEQYTIRYSTNYYTPSKNPLCEGYGLKVFAESELHSVDPDNFSPAMLVDFYEVILCSSLNNGSNIPYKELTSIDWFVKYNPDEIKKETVAGITYVRVPFKLCIDGFSYIPDFGLINNEMSNVAYFNIRNDGTYDVINFEYLDTHEGYLDSVIYNVLSTVKYD